MNIPPTAAPTSTTSAPFPSPVQSDLVVVVPVFDEEGNVAELAQEIIDAFHPLNRPFAILFVDDASRDRTWETILAARKKDPRVHGIRHGKNAGQSAALWTGLNHSQSRLIATLDGDRQNDPADLPAMLAFIDRNEQDFVCGFRHQRQDSWIRKVSSQIARNARSSVLGANFKDTGCALRLFRRECLNGVFGFNGLHRFLPILVHGGGFRVLEVPVNHRPRVAGVSKYGVWNRVWRGIADLFAVAWYQRRRLPLQPSLRQTLNEAEG